MVFQSIGVLNTEKFYRSLELLDFVIDPQELKYPIDKPTERIVYDVQNIILLTREI